MFVPLNHISFLLFVYVAVQNRTIIFIFLFLLSDYIYTQPTPSEPPLTLLFLPQDSTNREIHLGVTAIGLVVFQNGIKMNTFSWAKIVKISFKRKQFFIQLRREVVRGAGLVLGLLFPHALRYSEMVKVGHMVGLLFPYSLNPKKC